MFHTPMNHVRVDAYYISNDYILLESFYSKYNPKKTASGAKVYSRKFIEGT